MSEETKPTKKAKYKPEDREEFLAKRRAWHAKNRERLIQQKRARYIANREKILIAAKKYRVENPEKRKATWDNWFAKNREKRKEDWAKWYAENSRKFSDSTKVRRKDDPIYLITGRIRCTTTWAFRSQGFKKNSKTSEMLGCSWDHLKSHIERKFTKGMKWTNRHLWHIDHIVPLSSAKTEEELIKLAHFSNLQPLWKTHNLSKGDKIITCQPEFALSLL